MNCKVNGFTVSPETSLGDLIAKYGVNFTISFGKDEKEFFNDFLPSGIDPNDMLRAAAALSKTDKIAAIKVVRYCTGWGLKEGKELVEYLMTL